MKTKFLLFLFLVTTFRLYAESTSLTEAYHLTAEEYCFFLNDVAANDSNHMYDEKMASDLESASILRTGAPGSYYYVSKEREKKNELLLVSLSGMTTYRAWLRAREASLQKTDFLIIPFFKSDDALLSNRNSFYCVTQGFMNQCSGEELGTSWEELAEGVTLITSLAGGVTERNSRPQGQLRRGTRIRVEDSEEQSSSEEEKSEEESDSSWKVSRLVNRRPLLANVGATEKRQPRIQKSLLRGARTRIDSSEELLSSESSDRSKWDF